MGGHSKRRGNSGNPSGLSNSAGPGGPDDLGGLGDLDNRFEALGLALPEAVAKSDEAKRRVAHFLFKNRVFDETEQAKLADLVEVESPADTDGDART